MKRLASGALRDVTALASGALRDARVTHRHGHVGCWDQYAVDAYVRGELREFGIPLLPPDSDKAVDVALTGCDGVSSSKDVVKGGKGPCYEKN